MRSLRPTGKRALLGLAVQDFNGLPVKKQNPVLKQMRNAWFTLSASGQDLALKGVVQALDAPTAQRLKNLAEGFKSLGLLAAGADNPDPKVKAIAPLLPA